MKKLLLLPLLFLSGLLFADTPIRSGDGIAFTIVNSSLTFNVDTTLLRNTTNFSGDVSGTFNTMKVNSVQSGNYINDVKVSTAIYANTANTANSATSATTATNSTQLNGQSASYYGTASQTESNRVAISTNGTQNATNATDIANLKVSTGTLLSMLSSVGTSTANIQTQIGNIGITTNTLSLQLGTTASYVNTVSLQVGTTYNALYTIINSTSQALALWQNTYKVSASTGILNGTLPNTIIASSVSVNAAVQRLANGTNTTVTNDGGGTWHIDASGTGGAGDNLGNHIATTTLQMGNYAIQSSSSITANEFIINGTGQGGNTFYDSDGSNYVIIKASGVIPSNLTLYPPISLGTAGQAWFSDGAGGTYPASISGGGDMLKSVDGANIAGATDTLRVVISTQGIAIANLGIATGTVSLQVSATAQALTLWQNTYKVSPSTGILAGTLSPSVMASSVTDTAAVQRLANGTNTTAVNDGGGTWHINASGTGSDGGIVSPATFTWVNNYGLSLSTLSVVNQIAVGSITATTKIDISSGEYWLKSIPFLRSKGNGTALFIGKNAGPAGDYGNNSIGIGMNALPALDSLAYDNTAIGATAGSNLLHGHNNTLIGGGAGASLVGEYLDEQASYNTFLGYLSGIGSTCTVNNVMIGYMAGYNETHSNRLHISQGNTFSPLIYGEFDTNLVKINGNFITTGTITGTYLYGNGSNLTLVNSDTLDNQHGSYYGTATQTESNRVAISTEALAIASIIVSTTNIQSQLNNVAISTGVNYSYIASTWAYAYRVSLSTGLLAQSTTYLQTQINNIGTTTETLRVAISTNGVQNETNRVAISTISLAMSSVILSTTNIQTQINNIGTTTGTLSLAISSVGWTTPLAVFGSSATFMLWGSTAQVSGLSLSAFTISSVTVALHGTGSASVRLYICDPNTMQTATGGTAILSGAITASGAVFTSGVNLASTAVAVNKYIMAVTTILTTGETIQDVTVKITGYK